MKKRKNLYLSKQEALELCSAILFNVPHEQSVVKRWIASINQEKANYISYSKANEVQQKTSPLV